MKCAAVFIFVSFAIASQALAVLRPLFPVKPSLPYSGEVIGDELVRVFRRQPQLNTEMSTLEKPGVEVKENGLPQLGDVDRLITKALVAAHLLI